MSVIPASAHGKTLEKGVGSAFSRGDLLTLNSSSSLSRSPDTASTGVVGVALADSTKSIQGRVTVQIPDADSVFWVSIVPGSTWTAGSGATIAYSAASRNYLTSAATGGKAAKVLKGTAEVNQSGESRVLVELVRNDGSVLFS